MVWGEWRARSAGGEIVSVHPPVGGRDRGELWSVLTPSLPPTTGTFIGTRHLAVRVAAWQEFRVCLDPGQSLR